MRIDIESVSVRDCGPVCAYIRNSGFGTYRKFQTYILNGETVMLFRRTLILTTCLLLVEGCSQAPTMWQCKVEEESGFAVLEMEKVRVVFEGIRLTPNPGRVGGGAGGSMQIAGRGTSTTILTAFGQELSSSYRSNVNTIALGDFGLKITEGGRKLVVGDHAFDISEGKQTIVIHPDGSAENAK